MYSLITLRQGTANKDRRRLLVINFKILKGEFQGRFKFDLEKQ